MLATSQRRSVRNPALANVTYLPTTSALRAAATKAARVKLSPTRSNGALEMPLSRLGTRTKGTNAQPFFILPSAAERKNRPIQVSVLDLGDMRIDFSQLDKLNLYTPDEPEKPKSIVRSRIITSDKVKTHLSLEGGQCGKLTLEQCLQLIQKNRGGGFQPSIYLLMKDFDKGTFKSPRQIKNLFEKYGLRFDVASLHCMVWAEGMAATMASGLPLDLRSTRPFLPSHLHNASANEILGYTRDTITRCMELLAALNQHIVPMFMANYAGPHVQTKYPWGFFEGPGYDLLKEGDERFVKQTEWLRSLAGSLDMVLAQEIHPNCMADSGFEFNRLKALLGNDRTWKVWGDPSHCWTWESWQERLKNVHTDMVGTHIKNFVFGFPEGGRESNWLRRFHRFADFIDGHGVVDMPAYVQMLWGYGIIQRYCQLQQTDSCALSGELEAPGTPYNVGAKLWFNYGRRNGLLIPRTSGSLEEGMAK